MYKIVLTQRAFQDLDDIDKIYQHRIAEKLKKFSEDPLKYARKLSIPKIGSYRFRIGDFRVIFDIDGENIVVLRIGHRKSIYR